MRKHRIDYLAIDRSLLRRCSHVPPIKFAMSKCDGWEIVPLDQKFPNAYTPLKQVIYSCHKVGSNLFRPDDGEFDLSDPHMYRGHATVEYNQLYDPALESYFQQPSVWKRLQDLNMVNDKGDAICSRRYFFQYLRFLESRRSGQILKELTRKHAERITGHMRELRESKLNVRRQPDDRVEERRRQRLRLIQRKRRLKIKESELKIEQSLERARALKEKKLKELRCHLTKRRKDFETSAQKLRVIEAARKQEMNTIFSVKLELAALRKKMVKLTADNVRSKKEADVVTKQYVQREESRIASAYLVHCREKEMFDNILARIRRIENENREIDERIEMRKVHAIKRAYETKTAARITAEFMAEIRWMLKEKAKKLNATDDEELLERYSKLTGKNVAKCVDLSFAILTALDTPYSTFDVIHQVSRYLLRLALTIPGFEMPTGSSEKKFVFETTGEILNAIKHDQLELIHSALDEREPSTRAVKKGKTSDHGTYNFYETGFAIGTPNTIGEPAYWDYMKSMKSIDGRRPTPVLNLRVIIKSKMTELFDLLENGRFTYPAAMEIRELMHFQDYQKFILAKNFSFLRRHVKLKVERYLSRGCAERRVERPTANRERVVLEISECMFTFPDDCMRLMHAIRTISKIICAEIHDSVQIGHVLVESFVP